jgi:hypothetical protein
MRNCALDVSQDALDSREVLLARVVHVKIHLLNVVRDVRAHEGEVLERPGEAPVLSRVGERVADLQAVMPDLSRIPVAYLACERCMPEDSQVTAMPMK